MAETSRQNSMSGDQFFFADQERRPLHIMLIDDDKVCLTMLAHACESAGHLCETYSSPVRAMQAYNRAPEDYDVVLTDLQMPEIDGLQVLKDVRRINAERCSHPRQRLQAMPLLLWLQSTIALILFF